MDFDRKVFASRLRARRAELDLNQDQISEKTGVSTVTISKYERGEYAPGAEAIFSLCTGLGCDPNWLMGWRETPKGE